MEIFDLIDSKAIAEHLKSINYQCSPTQKAFFAATSYQATIKQKHEAFQTILATEQDEKVPRRPNTREYPSLFALLKRHMEIENELIDEFYTAKNAIYRFRYLCEGDQRYCEDFDTVYPDLASCVKDYKEDIESYADQVCFYEIRMDSLTEIGKYILLKFTTEGEVLGIDPRGLDQERYDILSAFEGMWFDIPTPFKRGDVLYIPDAKHRFHSLSNPVVLDYLSTWSAEKCMENGCFQVGHTRSGRDHLYHLYQTDGDISDMCVCGYFGCESGDFYRESSDATILEFEYYDKPITGGYRILQILSDYLKGELDLASFTSLAHYFVQEEALRDNRRYLSACDAYLQKLGVI